ncbi:hypothetical protein L2E82_23014 [Cichorium intybus]|uniref:Uncharacterized protein n=1 Tax=Cichorium intybus TaxID=13427 RepID=A0ACB9DZC5_CICIN|nr:hypothetical protein L2E82_23014 [Cichorium intybus]
MQFGIKLIKLHCIFVLPFEAFVCKHGTNSDSRCYKSIFNPSSFIEGIEHFVCSFNLFSMPKSNFWRTKIHHRIGMERFWQDHPNSICDRDPNSRSMYDKR